MTVVVVTTPFSSSAVAASFSRGGGSVSTFHKRVLLLIGLALRQNFRDGVIEYRTSRESIKRPGFQFSTVVP